MNTKKIYLEPHQKSIVTKLNWLRAAVLGANDGIVSISGLVLGVAGATNSTELILTTGVAGIMAGSLSMAVGEYVSVSSSRDTQHALIQKKKYELKHYPQEKQEVLTIIYQKKGLSPKTAAIVAKELTDKDPIKACLDAEVGINPEDLTNPWHAAIASALSFFAGSLIPLAAILLPPPAIRIPVSFLAIIFTLIITGAVSGRISGANIPRAILRIVIGGVFAMSITYIIGRIFNVTLL